MSQTYYFRAADTAHRLSLKTEKLSSVDETVQVCLTELPQSLLGIAIVNHFYFPEFVIVKLLRIDTLGHDTVSDKRRLNDLHC